MEKPDSVETPKPHRESVGPEGTAPVHSRSAEQAEGRSLRRELARPFYPFGFRYRLETGFQAYNYQEFAWQMRTAAVLSVALYGCGALLDYLFFPEQFLEVWLIRGSFVLLSGVLVTSSFFVRHDRPMQWLYVLGILLAAVGNQWIMMITPELVGHPYVSGMPMVALVGYIFIRLRFWYATFTGWSMTVMMAFMVSFDHGFSVAQLIADAYFMVVANLLGMTASLLLETQIRKNYLRSSLMEIEAVRLAESNRQLEEWSFVDALTGIANRRHLETYLQQECARAQRESTSLSLIMLDIDHFKAFNDHHGHQAGDRCLQKVAQVLSEEAYRGNDLVARYGGEEFAIVLPDTPLADARQVAERICESIRLLSGQVYGQTAGQGVTVSAGVSSLKGRQDLGPEDLIRLADEALYRAKDNGRDRVEVAAQPAD